MLHLTKFKKTGGMWLCPRKQSKILRNPNWRKPFAIEFPMWASVGISINKWNQFIKATDNYHFHIWLPDIAMQFNEKNQPSLIIPDLYCFNHQNLKKNMSISSNSATSSKKVTHFILEGIQILNIGKKDGVGTLIIRVNHLI